LHAQVKGEQAAHLPCAFALTANGRHIFPSREVIHQAREQKRALRFEGGELARFSD